MLPYNLKSSNLLNLMSKSNVKTCCHNIDHIIFFIVYELKNISSTLIEYICSDFQKIF